MGRLWLWVALVCLLIACGSDSRPAPRYVYVQRDASMDLPACVDNDGDGFGDYCGLRDCDDNDPTITDVCYRCKPEEPDEGCPCEPGAEEVFCLPPSYEGVENGVHGTYVCSEGTRYCRDGEWGPCKFVGSYVFVPHEQ